MRLLQLRYHFSRCMVVPIIALVTASFGAEKTELLLTEAPTPAFVGATTTFVFRLQSAETKKPFGAGFKLELYDGGRKLEEKATTNSGRVRFTVPVNDYGSKVLTVKFFTPNRNRWTSTRADVAIQGRLARISIGKAFQQNPPGSKNVSVTLTGHLDEIDNAGNVLGPIRDTFLVVGIAKLAGPGTSLGAIGLNTDANGNIKGSYVLDLQANGVRFGDEIFHFGYIIGNLFRVQYRTRLR